MSELMFALNWCSNLKTLHLGNVHEIEAI